MQMTRVLAACAALAIAPLAVASQAAAQTRAASGQDDRAFGERLTAALQSRDLTGALALLDTRPDIVARPDGLRLHAELLFRTGRREAAIAELDAYLTRATGDALARFQLAEMHFSAGRLPQAAFNYRLARAGALDGARRGIVEARLREIASRRGWQGQLTASLGPDSNLNSATSATTIDLFGLPFALSPDGRRRSGVSVGAAGSLEGRLPLNERSAVLVTLSGSGQGALDGDYSIVDGQAALGLERRAVSGAKIALQPFVGRRYFGGDLLDTSWGLQAAFDGPLTSNLQWSGAAQAELSDDRISDSRDGVGYAASIVRTRYLGPSALWQASASVNRRDIDAEADSFSGGAVTLGRLVATPGGTLTYVRAGAGYRRFDAVSSLFGVRREDRDVSAAVRVSKRGWSLVGAAPFVQVSSARTTSTVPLSGYSRNRLEFGFTRSF